ncbi:MAG: hypothetical protein OXC19_09620 [Bryobacterales bacterium]|nr:hypothetical protein [Bryobacterales bacterium]
MIQGQQRKDLYVLVADQDMLETTKGLLGRTASLGIRTIEYAITKHLNRDSGCRTNAPHYLRSYISNYDYALVMFDREGCGNDKSREEIQSEVETDLAANGWRERSKAIVIDPELENWVWAGSNQVPKALGLGSTYQELRAWLGTEDLWPPSSRKPSDPNKAMRAALKKGRKRASSRLFVQLATSTKLQHCKDPEFNEFRDTLRLWFPAVLVQSISA